MHGCGILSDTYEPFNHSVEEKISLCHLKVVTYKPAWLERRDSQYGIYQNYQSNGHLIDLLTE